MSTAKTKIIDLKKLRVRLEEEVVSIRDRIRDIEWRIDGTSQPPQALMDERQRALDKLRATQKDLLGVREDLIEQGAD